MSSPGAAADPDLTAGGPTGRGAPGASTDASPGGRGESLVRGGALSLAGFVVAAVAGFLLTLVVGRGLGPSGAGTFFVVVGVVAVMGTVARLGADTGLVWALPRATALGRRSELATTVRVALVPVAVLGLVSGTTLFLAADLVAGVVDPRDPDRSAALLRAVSPFLAVAGPAGVLVAGLRGTGGVGAYTLLQNVGLPLSRFVLVLLGVVVGTGVLGVLLLWAGPLVALVAAAGILLRLRLRRLAPRPSGPAASASGVPGRRSTREVAGGFWRFALPRSATAVLEVVLVWADVLVLAALTSPVEAGVYAAASRFITTGTMVEAASRVTVAPRVSRLLATGDVEAASGLHTRATTAVVALSWPIYLVLGLGSMFALSLFGPGFEQGATALTVLAAAMLVAMLTGNSQTMLLMSGRSAWQLGNRVVSVILKVSLLLVLVPDLGLVGAAYAWAATILVDSALVMLEVRFLVGLRTDVRPVLVAAGAALLLFGVPAAAARELDPGGAVAFVGALTFSCVAYALVGWLQRHVLGLDELVAGLRRRRPRDRTNDRTSDRTTDPPTDGSAT